MKQSEFLHPLLIVHEGVCGAVVDAETEGVGAELDAFAFPPDVGTAVGGDAEIVVVLEQIHQRSQRRQPRRLPSPLSQNQQKNRKTTSFMILFKIRCLDSSSVMPFFKASSIDMTGYASTTGFSSE